MPTVEEVIFELKAENKQLLDKLKGVEEAAKKAAQPMTEIGVKASEGFRVATEGGFKFARGIAFLGASGEEELQKILQGVAQVQGAFDLFRGSIEIVKGVNDALKALNLTALAGPLGLVALLGVAAAAWLTFGASAETATDKGLEGLEKNNQKLQEFLELQREAARQAATTATSQAIERVNEQFFNDPKGRLNAFLRLQSGASANRDVAGARAFEGSRRTFEARIQAELARAPVTEENVKEEARARGIGEGFDPTADVKFARLREELEQAREERIKAADDEVLQARRDQANVLQRAAAAAENLQQIEEEILRLRRQFRDQAAAEADQRGELGALALKGAQERALNALEQFLESERIIEKLEQRTRENEQALKNLQQADPTN